MNKLLKYIPFPIASTILTLCYFSPWLSFGNYIPIDRHDALGFYIIAFFAFMVAWIPLFVTTVLTIVYKVKKRNNWKLYLTISLSILLFYVAVTLGMVNNYVVTV